MLEAIKRTGERISRGDAITSQIGYLEKTVESVHNEKKPFYTPMSKPQGRVLNGQNYSQKQYTPEEIERQTPNGFDSYEKDLELLNGIIDRQREEEYKRLHKYDGFDYGAV